MFTAYIVGHPNVIVRRNAGTPFDALQSLFAELVQYAPKDAQSCATFWDRDTVNSDFELLSKVEGYCGAFAFECVACNTAGAN